MYGRKENALKIQKIQSLLNIPDISHHLICST